MLTQKATTGLLALAALALFPANAAHASGTTAVKEWTLLVYLNGNNSLDSFGPMDINEMEQVGSLPNVNVVVQWASEERGDVERLLVQKDNDTDNVTSPILEHLGSVDMGDYNSLVDFVKWGVQKYPAQHYFVDVWNHGGGWHRQADGVEIRDISWDDTSGNHITTEQLGVAMAQSALAIGHKVDFYASDACLMGMAEVASEMADSVAVYGGSQEVEPGPGWDYAGLLKGWKAGATAADIGRLLTQTYVTSYQGGSQGDSEVTFAAYDLSKIAAVYSAIRNLGTQFSHLSTTDRRKVVTAANGTQTFTYSDYGDLLDFLGLVQKAGITSITADVYKAVTDAVGQFVIANQTTSSYAKAKGLSIWLPHTMSDYNSYGSRYAGLNLNKQTAWGSTLQSLLK